MFKSKKIRLFTEYFKIKELLNQLEQNKSKLIFFFPSYHMGGAERVHVDILSVFQEDNPVCILTGNSNDNYFEKEFREKSTLINLGQYKSTYYKFYAKKVAKILNKKEDLIIFGCNSGFFYYMLPYLNKNIRVIDLLHAFSPEYKRASEKISLPYVEKIHRRIVLGNKTFHDYQHQYTENGIDLSLLSRVRIIPNKVDVPDKLIKKEQNNIKKAVFVARNSEEKRPELLLDIAKECLQYNLPIQFHIAGDFPENFTQLENVKMLGVLNKEELNQLYRSSDFILVTSWREGLPMVILEAMAYGVIPISTTVGEIPSCLSHYENGILIQDKSIEFYTKKDENYNIEYIVTRDKFVTELENLIQNNISNKQHTISQNAYNTVKENFSNDVFSQSYKNAIFEE